MYGFTGIEIMDAFEKLLGEEPFNKVTILSICRKAKVNRQSFYYHFQSLTDLLVRTLKRGLKEEQQSWGACRLPSKGYVILLSYIKNNAEMIRNIYNSSYKGIMMETFVEAGQGLVENLVRLEAEEKDIHIEDQDVRYVRGYFQYSFVGTLNQFIENNMEGDTTTLTTVCAKILRISIRSVLDTFTAEGEDGKKRFVMAGGMGNKV